MAKQVFKGFKQIDGSAEGFTPTGLVNGYLYFVRTNADSADGYLYFNGKRYGTAADVAAVINAKIGTLPEGYTNLVDYINDQVTAITSDYATKEEVGTLSGRVDNLEAISAGTRLDTLEAVSADTRLTDLETSAATWNASAHTHSNKDVLDGITAEKVTDWDEAAASAHTHSNKDLLDTYTQTEEDLANAVSKAHEHSNKSVLDGITTEKVAAWDEAAASAVTKSEFDSYTGATDTRLTNLETSAATFATTATTEALQTAIDEATGRTEEVATSADTRLTNLEASAHTHDNMDVLDDITAEKVAAWDEAAASAVTKSEFDSYTAATDASIASADTRLATIESGYTQNSVYDAYTAATDSKIEALSGISADTRIAALEAVSGGVQEIVSGDTSVTIGAKDSENKQTVAVAISSDTDNAIEVKSDGLFAGIYYYEEGDALPE